jgi:hypothetical protein
MDHEMDRICYSLRDNETDSFRAVFKLAGNNPRYCQKTVTNVEQELQSQLNLIDELSLVVPKKVKAEILKPESKIHTIFKIVPKSKDGSRSFLSYTDYETDYWSKEFKDQFLTAIRIVLNYDWNPLDLLPAANTESSILTALMLEDFVHAFAAKHSIVAETFKVDIKSNGRLNFQKDR